VGEGPGERGELATASNITANTPSVFSSMSLFQNSQNPKVLPLQPGIAQGVMPTFAMLATIGLDDQACAEVHEVEHIRPQRLLAAKLLPTQPMGAQVVPEHALGVGHVAPQLTGEVFLIHGIRALLELVYPSPPPPLPQGERGDFGLDSVHGQSPSLPREIAREGPTH